MNIPMVYYRYTLVHVKKKYIHIYSSANVHAVFSFDSGIKIFVHVFYVPLQRPHLPEFLFLLFFGLIFCQSRFFLENVAHLKQNLFQRIKKKEKKVPDVRPRDGHVEHLCKISGSISQTRRGHLNFWCVK